MTFRLEILNPLTPLAPKFPNFATQILLETHCCRHHRRYKLIFYATWVRGVACQKL